MLIPYNKEMLFLYNLIDEREFTHLALGSGFFPLLPPCPASCFDSDFT